MPQASTKYVFPGWKDKIELRLNIRSARNAYWSWYEPRNFGDWVTPFLVEAMTGRLPRWCSLANQKRSTCIYGAGSILRHIPVDDMVTVWGSGIISEQDQFARPARVCAVRGPRSAMRLKQLGYKSTEVFGDPAILLPRYYTPKSQQVSGRIGIVAHYVDQELWSGPLPDGVVLIDVAKPVDEVIEAICSCEFTLSSSLHGLIVSHTYGRRSAWIASAKPLAGDNVKFADYYEAGCVSNVAAIALDRTADYKTMNAIIEDSPQPDVISLFDELDRQCPFKTGTSQCD